MDALRVGGLASGLDTNSIVDALVAQAKLPVQRLNGKLTLKALEKTVYKGINDSLASMRTDMLSMKLEATFKSKKVANSDIAVFSATANANAATGSHVVTVSKTATKSYVQSTFTHARLVTSGAGVTKTTGVPGALNQLEGSHTVTVSEDAGVWTASSEFELSSGGRMKAFSANGYVDALFADANGAVTASASGTLQFSVDGTNLTALSLSYAVGTDVSEIASDIESKLNTQLNTHFASDRTQYVSVNARFDSAAGKWAIDTYNVSGETFTLGVVDGGNTMDDTLGLNTGFTVSDKSKMTKTYSAASAAALLSKLNDAQGGLIPGITLTSTALTEGSFVVAQDSTMRVGISTYSRVVGATVTAGVLNTTVMGLNNSGLTSTPTNGYFSINNVKITIDDYSTMSVNDLLGKINSSGAGVTASYNTLEKRFELKSTTSGATSITLGSTGDTSDALTALKLSINAGATKVTGADAGKIDADAALGTAGFTSTITSGLITVNGVSLYIDATKDTLNTVIDKVNKSGAGVTMRYDANRDKVSITGDSVDRITLGSSNDTSSLLKALNLVAESDSGEKSYGIEGQLAEFSVNGVNYVRTSNSVNDVIDGVTLSLASAGTATVDISIDTDKSVKVLASFIQHYNTTMSTLNSEKVTDDMREYMTPLSDEESSSMAESDLTTYQENFTKYNSYDMINKSSELRLLRQSVRGNVLGNVTGTTGQFNNLSQLGIDIAGDGDLDIEKKGFLLIDSTDYDEILEELQQNNKVLENLRTNADDVYTFFSSNTDTAEGWVATYQKTLNTFIDPVDGLISAKVRANGTFDSQMLRISDMIDKQSDRVESFLEATWRKFTAMETAVSQIQSKGSQLNSMIAKM